MRSWEQASVIAFVYLFVVALVRGGHGARARAVTAASAGLLLTAVSIGLPRMPIVHDAVLPLVVLLVYYWGTGALFVAPMLRVEQWLSAIDEWFGIRRLAARLPPIFAQGLELAYTAVYPTIPVALWLAWRGAQSADRFWTVVLVTDYICFGCLPWIQTRPPRTIEPELHAPSALRRLNLQILEAGGVRVNTVPSGHAAEALACALLLLHAPWPIVIAIFVNAAAISAGAVVGRYHFAADAMLGWLVAVMVWIIF